MITTTTDRIAHSHTSFSVRVRMEVDPNRVLLNFTKFIIDRQGNVVARFEPTADMKDVEACVKALL